jgi:hypothetical protein
LGGTTRDLHPAFAVRQNTPKVHNAIGYTPLTIFTKALHATDAWHKN